MIMNQCPVVYFPSVDLLFLIKDIKVMWLLYSAMHRRLVIVIDIPKPCDCGALGDKQLVVSIARVNFLTT